ncbi:MAG TPA: hypothetical protein QGH92_03035, partial [Candidatus Parcubacteria bacterium]|nr:hypothetical protein [Candidatus Parcubacteria bacterium]
MPVITGTMNLARILQTHLVNGETMLGGEGPAAAVNPLLLDGVMMATGALCVLLTEDGATFRCVDSQLRVILMPQLGIAPTVWRVEPRPDGGGASADSIP